MMTSDLILQNASTSMIWKSTNTRKWMLFLISLPCPDYINRQELLRKSNWIISRGIQIPVCAVCVNIALQPCLLMTPLDMGVRPTVSEHPLWLLNQQKRRSRELLWSMVLLVARLYLFFTSLVISYCAIIAIHRLIFTVCSWSGFDGWFWRCHHLCWWEIITATTTQVHWKLSCMNTSKVCLFTARVGATDLNPAQYIPGFLVGIQMHFIAVFVRV